MVYNSKNFDLSLLDIQKLSSKTTDVIIYNIKHYLMGSLDREDPLYIAFNNADGYIEESSGNKYLTLASTDKNKKALTKYTELWN